MSNYLNLLPRDNHDFERVNELKNISKQDLIKLIPELLEWLQDINWPIAREISKLLLTVPENTIPYVNYVLKGEDHICQKEKSLKKCM